MMTKPILPELHSGDVLRSKSGGRFAVVRVSRPREYHEHIEPVYRLRSTVTGVLSKREWTLDELNEAGAEFVGR